MKRKIKQENEEQIKKELTSESYASLMSRSPEVVYPCPWRWGFFFWQQRKRREAMEECANGFAEHPTGYFIDQGGALGVMIWPVHTVGIPSGRGFHQVRRVFF
jgi:hypothetical protein